MSETRTETAWQSAHVAMAYPVDAGGMREAREAYVHPDAPGLAVTACLGNCFGWWSVTHIASGRAIHPDAHDSAIRVRGDAERFALALAPLTDWTRDMGAVMADKPTLAPKVNAVRVEVFGEDAWDHDDNADGRDEGYGYAE